MNVLNEITTFLDSINDNPGDIDLNQVKTILTISYEVAHDGLKRSQDAAEFSKLKPIYEELKTEYDSLVVEHSKFKVMNEKLNEDISKFSNLLDTLKDALKGKVHLIPTYSQELKDQYLEDIDSSSITRFISLNKIIENDFANTWKENEEVVIDNSNLVFVDSKNYNS